MNLDDVEKLLVAFNEAGLNEEEKLALRLFKSGMERKKRGEDYDNYDF